jgi:hypothetical protein
VTQFLKKSGGMGGGDSETYYYGNMLLEKMRIWSGEKKSKTRGEGRGRVSPSRLIKHTSPSTKADDDRFPDGRYRTDPAHFKMLCLPGEVPTRTEVANMKR